MAESIRGRPCSATWQLFASLRFLILFVTLAGYCYSLPAWSKAFVDGLARESGDYCFMFP